jgi:hypothetical protein
MCGLGAITAGTGVDMYGSRDDGRFRLANTQCGSLPDGSTAMTDMFLSKAGGGRSAKHAQLPSNACAGIESVSSCYLQDSCG